MNTINHSLIDKVMIKQFKQHQKQLLVGIILLSFLLLGSCASFNTNEMFTISKKDNFQYDSIPLGPLNEHKICAGDRFSFSFSTNNGEKIIFGSSGVSNPSNTSTGNNPIINQDYLVQLDGHVELPLIGKIKVEGLTTETLEENLELLLSKDYLLPFVQIRLTNERVVIFPGQNSGQVINLQNSNTSLIEVIAMANGIRTDGYANSIKLIRKIENKRVIYKIDLSTIEGLKQGDMFVQGNDYIYIHSKKRTGGEILKVITPWLSVFSSSLAIYALIIK